MNYLICNRRRSKPKVRVDVCRKCRHRRSCPDYAAYREPSLFAPSTGAPHRRKTRTAGRRPASPAALQEQLSLLPK